MRKVKYKVYTKYPKEFTFKEGLFHTWGVEFEEFESGPGNYTVGIIEKEDGEIITSVPTDIIFLKD